MKTFKEAMQDDITNIFFDLTLFGEIHDVDGVEMNLLIDNEELKKRNSTKSVHTDGLYTGSVLFFAIKKDFEYPPEVEGVLRLDGDLYRVGDVKEYDGVLEVLLEANLS